MTKRRKLVFIGFGIYLLLFFSISCCVTLPTVHEVQVIQKSSISPLEGIDYEIDSPLITRVDQKIFIVPKGFETDLASIPRWLWILIAPNEADYVFPAILHDYLYSCHDNHSRQFIDDVFYSYLRERGVSAFKAYQFYIGVRIFGGTHFDAPYDCLLMRKI